MLDDIVGQKALKQSIKVSLDAARFEKGPLRHILLSGPGGVGKSHILKSVCGELGYRLAIEQGNHFKPKDVPEFFLKHCQDAQPAFVIIDEIHELSNAVQEEFYYPMVDGVVLQDGKPVKLGQLTIAGATTRLEDLDTCLIDRFTYEWKVEPMSVADLVFLINRFFLAEKAECSFDNMRMIACRSRGIPRIALKLARRSIDYAHAYSRRNVTDQDVIKTFTELGLDELGLDADQRRFLTVLYNNEEPMGLENIAMTMNIGRPDRIKYVIEPFLRKEGLISTVSKGRELTERGYQHVMKSCGLGGEL